MLHEMVYCKIYTGLSQVPLSALLTVLGVYLGCSGVCNLVADYLCGDADFRFLFNCDEILPLVANTTDSLLLHILTYCKRDLNLALDNVAKLTFIRGFRNDDLSASLDTLRLHWFPPGDMPYDADMNIGLLSIHSAWAERLFIPKLDYIEPSYVYYCSFSKWYHRKNMVSMQVGNSRQELQIWETDNEESTDEEGSLRAKRRKA